MPCCLSLSGFSPMLGLGIEERWCPCPATCVGCDYGILFRIRGWFVVVLVGLVSGPQGVRFNSSQQAFETLTCRKLAAFQTDDAGLHLIQPPDPP